MSRCALGDRVSKWASRLRSRSELLESKEEWEGPEFADVCSITSQNRNGVDLERSHTERALSTNLELC